MKLFISYSHKDQAMIQDFITAMSPMKGDGKPLSDIWYDRNITAGDDFWDRINEHLDGKDVICLFISPDYLASRSCKEEMRRALSRRKNENTLVIPVILRPCSWLDESEELSQILAVPTDGTPVSKFNDKDDAWQDVYYHLKKAITLHKKIKELEISKIHQDFLNSATVFAKSHPQKNTLFLEDIFVYPFLNKIKKDSERSLVQAKNLIKDFQPLDKVVIIGEDQSGKTSLLKRFFLDLRKQNFIPLYLDGGTDLQGNFQNKLEKVFSDQYQSDLILENIPKERIVILIDNFHKIKRPSKYADQFASYGFILVIDDIFALDTIKNVPLSQIARYQIRQLAPSQRSALIEKWLEASDAPLNDTTKNNENLEQLDNAVREVETSIGKVFGKKIMPSYPYFILMVLAVREDTDRPLDENVSSQGHCYQALIVAFLKNKKVSNSNLDAYLNFLTEFAFRIYLKNGAELTALEFDKFIGDYKKEFNVDNIKGMLTTLDAANIMSKTSLGNYGFNSPYIYYFFAGKYFAQAWDDARDPNHSTAIQETLKIFNNLHKTSNAYIAVFIAHHTKNREMIEHLIKVANAIYSNISPASFNRECLSVFAQVEPDIKNPVLPQHHNPKENRLAVLNFQDRQELADENYENTLIEDDEEDEIGDNFTRELRQSLKTVEVLGSILKNRSGSLRNEQLERLFTVAMDINLRLSSNFLELVQQIANSPEAMKLLANDVKDSCPSLSEDEVSVRTRKLFWGLNFSFLFSIIKKTAFSLGSSEIAKIAKKVCEERNTPASYMLKHTIIMWFKKNIDIQELQRMDKAIDNETARKAMRWLISDYCQMHIINYRDQERLKALGLKRALFLPSPDKEK